MFMIFWVLITCVLAWTNGEVYLASTPSQVVSIAPFVVEMDQAATIHTFGLKPFNITYTTKIDPDSFWTDIPANYSHASEPFEGIHRAVLLYKYPYRSPIPGWSASMLNLSVEFGNTRSHDTQPITLSHNFLLQHLSPIILVETNKPCYAPGDTVHFSVDILQPEHWTLSGVAQSHTGHHTITRSVSVEVRTGSDRLIRRWDHMTSLPLLLSLPIPQDAIAGIWTINVYSWGQSATVRVRIANRTSAQPTVQFKEFPWTLSKYDWVQLEVCANQTDGHPGQGQVEVEVCQCAPTLLEWISDYSVSMTHCHSNTYPTPCTKARDRFDSNGCVNLRFPISEMTTSTNFTYSHLYHFKVACAQIFDSPTARSFTVCDALGLKNVGAEYPQTSVPEYYKYGLPTAIILPLKQPAFVGGRVIVEVIKERNGCPLTATHNSTGKLGQTQMKWSVPLDDKQILSTVIPPIFSTDPIRVRILPDSPTNEPAYHELIDHIIPGMRTVSGEMIQLWPQGQKVRMHCNQPARVNLIGNTRLHGRKLYVYTFARGTMLTAKLYNDMRWTQDALNCQDEDGPLGHYICLGQDTIQCHPGWKGHGCLEPICAEHCDPIGGYCTEPGQCECQVGWWGSHCDRCSFCPTGAGCRYENDEHNCFCPEYNRTCSRSNITESPYVLRPISVELQRFPTVRSTKAIHKRTVEFSLTPSSIYGEFQFVIFYMTKLPNKTMEVISTVGTLFRTETCPGDKPRIWFESLNSSFPPLVKLTVLPRQTAKVAKATCHVRVWDERMLLTKSSGSWVDDERISKLLQSGMGYPVGGAVLGSIAEFRSASFSLAAPRKHMHPELAKCFKRGHSPYRNHAAQLTNQLVFNRNLLFQVDNPKLISDENKYGLQYEIVIPTSGGRWIAGANCYGGDMGLWSAFSEPLVVDQSIRLELAGVAQMNLLEVARVVATVSFASHTRERQCFRMHLRFHVDERIVRLTGSQNYTKCVCSDDDKLSFATTISPIRPHESTVIWTELFSDSSLSSCPVFLERPTTFWQFEKYTRLHTASHRIRIKLDQTLESTQGFLVCSDWLEYDDKEQNIHLSLPNIPNAMHRRPVGLYTSYSTSVTGPLLEYFKTIHKRPLTTAYHHLTIVSVGIHLLETLREVNHNTLAEHPILRSNELYSAVWTSVEALSLYRCSPYYAAYYAETCQSPDYELTLAALRTFNRLCRSTVGWVVKKLNNIATFHVWEIVQFLRSAQNKEGCFSGSRNKNQSDLSLSALVYISIKENLQLLPIWLEHLNEQKIILYRLESCILRLYERDLYTPSVRLYTHKTKTLANLVYALYLINPKTIALENTISHLQRRAIVRDLRAGEVNRIRETHWEDSSAGQNDSMLINMHIYKTIAHLHNRLDSLYAIVRWVVNQQNIFGEFSKPRELFYGSEILFDFARRIEHELTSQPDPHSSIRVTLRSSDGQIQSMKLNSTDLRVARLHMVDWMPARDQSLIVSINSSKLEYGQCLLGKIAYLFSVERAMESTQNHFNLNISSHQPNCQTAQIDVCLKKNARPIQVFLKPQSGWHLSEGQQEELIDWLKRRTRSRSLIKHIRFEDGHPIWMELRRTTGEMTNNCLQLRYHKVGQIDRAYPAELVASELGNSDRMDRIFYLLSECENETEENRPLEAPFHQLHFAQCPQLNHTWSDENLRAEIFENRLKSMCEQSVVMMEMEENRENVHIHEIDKFGSRTSRKVKLAPDSIGCFQLSMHNRFLLPSHTLYEVNPDASQLDVRMAHADPNPFELFVLNFTGPRFNRSMLESLECRNLIILYDLWNS